MYTDLELVVFLFAKEFGWHPEYVWTMQHRHFQMYVRELLEYYRARKCAADKQPYSRPKKATKIKYVNTDVKELASRLVEERNARDIQNKRNRPD